MIRYATLLLAALLPLSVAAQSDERGLALAFSLGVGAGTAPGYFGSDEAVGGPTFEFDFDAVRVSRFGLGRYGPAPIADGLGFNGSFRIVSERTADEYDELEGLDDVDATYELGGGGTFSRPWWEVFAVARQGIGGHESLVGEVGMDLISRPTDRLTLRAGPRILVGSDDYALTYFGVTPFEATTSDFAAFEAGGGVMSAGIEIAAAYSLSEKWDVEAQLNFDRLRNDAADSPITVDDDQLGASLALTRRFNFGF